MKFNDYKLSSDKECEILKSNYDKVFKQEIDDLNEILEKMTNQRDNLQKENISGRYSQLIDKLDEDILKLENIVRSTMYRKSTPSSYTLNIPSNLRKVNKLADNNGLSPVRSIEENERHQEYINNNSNTPTLTPNPPRRGRPIRGFAITDLLDKFSLKSNKKSATMAPIDRFRYHTIIATSCRPHNKIMHSQIDIIRLLLLYLTLRPHCQYTSIISTIANDQFESYVNLAELNE